MKTLGFLLLSCLSACASNGSEVDPAFSSHATALTAEPYACVTMRTPNDPATVSFSAPATVQAFGDMRADFIGTARTAADEQQADVTVTFSGRQDTPDSGSSASQFAIKLKELDPCNLIYVAYNVNAFNDGRDQLAIKVKRNDTKHTSVQCGAAGYNALKYIDIPVSQAVGADYAGTVRLKTTVKAPTAGGTYNICLSVWGDSQTGTLSPIISGQCFNLHEAPLDAGTWPTWGGVLGMRTDNVKATATFSVPAALNAVIQRDDSRWSAECETKLSGGGE